MEETKKCLFILRASSGNLLTMRVFAGRAFAQNDPLLLFNESSDCVDLESELTALWKKGGFRHGWYLNDSKSPNAIYDGENWFAARAIHADEEVTADYRTLDQYAPYNPLSGPKIL